LKRATKAQISNAIGHQISNQHEWLPPCVIGDSGLRPFDHTIKKHDTSSKLDICYSREGVKAVIPFNSSYYVPVLDTEVKNEEWEDSESTISLSSNDAHKMLPRETRNSHFPNSNKFHNSESLLSTVIQQNAELLIQDETKQYDGEGCDEQDSSQDSSNEKKNLVKALKLKFEEEMNGEEQINFPSCRKSETGIIDSATRENILGSMNANNIKPSDCGLNVSSKEDTENIIQGDNIDGCTYGN
jgi:hypothetical protein